VVEVVADDYGVDGIDDVDSAASEWGTWYCCEAHSHLAKWISIP